MTSDIDGPDLIIQNSIFFGRKIWYLEVERKRGWKNKSFIDGTSKIGFAIKVKA